MFGLKTVEPVRSNALKDLCTLHKQTVRQLVKYKCLLRDFIAVIFPELDKVLKHSRMGKSVLNLLLKYPRPQDIMAASDAELRQALLENVKTVNSYQLRSLEKITQLAQTSVGVKDYPVTAFQQTIKALLFYLAQVHDIKKGLKTYLKMTPYCKLLDEFGYDTVGLATILGEIGTIRRFPDHKHFVSYCGLSVTENTSGTSINKTRRLSKRGNSTLRQHFYIMVLPHIKHKTKYAEFFHRLRDSGKHPKKCMVATARKLAIKTYYDFKNCLPSSQEQESAA